MSKWDFRPVSPCQNLPIGLFGGSFNPAHQGHRHLALVARKRLGLAYVWWLPSYGHPLKSSKTPFSERPFSERPFSERMDSAQQQVHEPFMRISAAERHFSSSCTLHLVRHLQALLPQARLVWLMGEDCLAQFHLWRGWSELARTLPVASIARPGTGPKSRLSPFARRFADARLSAVSAQRLAYTQPPAWLHLNAPHRRVSSAFLRNNTGACKKIHANDPPA